MLTPIRCATAVALALTTCPLASQSRTLRHRVVVTAAPAKVWKAFTTADGMLAWMGVRQAEVDLRVGGTIRTTYQPDDDLGGRSTIVQRILSYEPERMLSLKLEQSPAGRDFEKLSGTWSVMRFRPLSAGRTEVTMAGMGYGEGAEWDRLYEFFETANDHVFDRLKQHFGAAAAEADQRKIWATLVGMADSDWVYEADGVRVVNRFERSSNGHGIVCRALVTRDGETVEHSSTLVWREPVTGCVRFVDVDQDGSVVDAGITLGEDGRMIWEWPLTTRAGERIPYRSELFVDDAAGYRFDLYREAESGWRKLHSIRHERHRR